MPGPAPKPAAKRQRRNRTTTAATLEGGPAAKVALTAAVPEHDWHTLALRTWETWWASPMVDEWVDADVPGLIELAALVDDFWWAEDAATRARLRAEIRMSGREYGISPLSRRQLQWEVRRLDPKTATPTAPRRARDTRSTLSVLQGRTG